LTLAGSRIESSKFYCCEKSCIDFQLYVGFKMATAKAYASNGLDTSENKALNLAGYRVTFANIVG
jgi:hypothetical protein